VQARLADERHHWPAIDCLRGAASGHAHRWAGSVPRGCGGRAL